MTIYVDVVYTCIYTCIYRHVTIVKRMMVMYVVDIYIYLYIEEMIMLCTVNI